jgi:sec-independent protein translocase protein TatA
MGGLAWWHWVLIIAAFILLFGAKKLPDAARGVGRSLRILKSEVAAMHDDDGKPKESGETDVSAAVATPPAQIAAAPVAPAPGPAAPTAPQQQVPVVNGSPASANADQHAS